MSRPNRVARPIFIGLIVLVLVGVGGPIHSAEDPVRARAFEVRYRALADAADLVGPLLTAEGSLTLRPRLSRLVVEDRASVLLRVSELLESFDLPPRGVEVTFTLFLGTDRREENSGGTTPNSVFSKEVRGVIDALGDFTKWTDYQPLGSRLVSGVEGEHLSAELSENYRVVFTVDSVTSRQGSDIVKFEKITLQRLEADETGEERVVDVHTTGVVLATGRLAVVGAATRPDSRRALFLTMQVETR